MSDPFPFSASNDKLKTITVDLVSMIPEAGPILGMLCDVLWPSGDDQQTYMQEVETYVEKYVSQKIQEALQTEEATLLLATLNTLKTDVKKIGKPEKNTTYSSDMQSAIKVTDDNMARYTPDGNNADPSTGLKYLVAFGTIRFHLYREAWVHWADVFPNATKKGHGPETKGAWPGLMKSDIDLLSAAVIKARNNIVATRVQQIHVDREDNIPDQWSTVMIGDTPSRVVSHTHTVWHLRDDGDASHNVDFDDEWSATNQSTNLIWDLSQSDGGFASQIDQLVDPFRYWPLLIPGAAPPAKSGLFKYAYHRVGNGSDSNSNGTFDHLQNFQTGPMDLMSIWGDSNQSWVGWNCFYNGQASGPDGIPLTPYLVQGNQGHVDITNRSLISYVTYATPSKVGLIAFGTNDDELITYTPTPGSTFSSYLSELESLPLMPFNVVKLINGEKIAFFRGVTSPSGIAKLIIVTQRPVDWDGGLMATQSLAGDSIGF